MDKDNFLKKEVAKLISKGFDRNKAIIMAFNSWTEGENLPKAQMGITTAAPLDSSLEGYNPANMYYGAPFYGEYPYDKESLESAQTMREKVTEDDVPTISKGYAGIDGAINLSDINDPEKALMSSANKEPLKKPTGNDAKEPLQFANPYGGVSLEGALQFAGRGFGQGDVGQGILGAGLAGLKGARSFMSGLGVGKENKRRENEYEDELYNPKIIYKRKDGGFIEYLEKGGNITNAEFLTGNFITDSEKPNVEIEDGEHTLNSETGQIQEAVGEKHDKGGIKTNLPNQSKVISDYLKVGKNTAKTLSEELSIKVNSKDTYAKVMDKVNNKNKLDKIIKEEASILEKVAQQEKNKDVPENVKNLNIKLLQKNLSRVQEKKQEIEGIRQNAFEKIFYKQEENKKNIEKQKVAQEMQDGGNIGEKTPANLGGEDSDFISLPRNEDKAREEELQNIYAQAKKLTADELEAFKEQKLSDEEWRGDRDRFYLESFNKWRKGKTGNTPNDTYSQTSPEYRQFWKDTKKEWYDMNPRKINEIVKDYSSKNKPVLNYMQEGGFKDYSSKNKPVLNYMQEGGFKDYSSKNKPVLNYMQEGGFKDYSSKNKPVLNYMQEGGFKGTQVTEEEAKKNVEAGLWKKLGDRKYVKEGSDDIITTTDVDSSELPSYRSTWDKDRFPVFEDYVNAAEKWKRENPNWRAKTKTEVQSGIPDEYFYTVPNFEKLLYRTYGEGKTGNKKNDKTPTTASESQVENVKEENQEETQNNTVSKGNKRIAPMLPQEFVLPPDAMESIFKSQANLSRIDPVKISPEVNIQELERQKQAAVEGLNSLPPALKAVAMANLIGQTQDNVNKTITTSELANQQELARVEGYNAKVADKENLVNQQFLENYERKVMQTRNINDANIRNYFNKLDDINRRNFEDIRGINLTNAMYDKFDTDGTNIYFNNSKPNFTVKTPTELSNMTPEELEEYKRTYNEQRSKE